MEGIIVASVTVLIPIAVAVVMRANAGAMFLAGCGGIVLLSTLDPVLVTTAGALFPSQGEAMVRIMVVLASIVIAAILFKDSIFGTKMVANVLIAFLLGLLLVLQLPALTGLTQLVNLIRLDWWRDLELYESAVVVAGLGVSLVMVLVKKHAPKKSHKKH